MPTPNPICYACASSKSNGVAGVRYARAGPTSLPPPAHHDVPAALFPPSLLHLPIVVDIRREGLGSAVPELHRPQAELAGLMEVREERRELLRIARRRPPRPTTPSSAPRDASAAPLSCGRGSTHAPSSRGRARRYARPRPRALPGSYLCSPRVRIRQPSSRPPERGRRVSPGRRESEVEGGGERRTTGTLRAPRLCSEL